MLLSDIKPFVRFVRNLELTSKSSFNPVVPYDARLFYTSQGNGEIEIEGLLYKMTTGSVLLINSGVEYHLKTPQTEVTYFAVNFDYTFERSDLVTPIPPVIKSKFRVAQHLENIKLDDFNILQTHLYIPNMRKIESLCQNLGYEYTHKFNHFQLVSSSILSEILFTLFRRFETTEPQYYEELGEILNYIHKNFKEPLTNSVLAEKFGFHPNYLSKKIKQHTGIPLHRYLLQVRIMQAILLLESGEKNISLVAESCGFPNVYHFSKAFKNIVGVSPKKYLY